MVRFAARHEYARTVEDVLARRIRLLFLDAALAGSLAAEVGELLRQETGVDPQAAAFRELALSWLKMPS
jgi:glycerol-3-phosphate dehydrogenase